MATEILRAYGWECGNTMLNDVDMASGGVNLSSVAAKTGTYSLSISRLGLGYSYSWARFAIPGSPSDPSVSVWVYLSASYDITATASSGSCIRFLLSTGEYVELRWNGATHTFDAYVDDVLEEAGTIEVSSNTWFHVQFYVEIADAGSIQVKINGHESINYSVDTQPDTAATASYLRLHGGRKGSDADDFYDDLILGSGGYLGDLRCVDIRPNADGTVQYTPSTGSDNYAMVDETPPSDSDYNETDVDGNADELDCTDFDGVTYIPVAVTAWVRARQDAGVGDSIEVGVDSGGTDDMSAAQALSDSFEYFFHTLDDNPADAAEWEDADIDALKLRYEAVIP
jgi:hypothetical protein